MRKELSLVGLECSSSNELGQFSALSVGSRGHLGLMLSGVDPPLLKPLVLSHSYCCRSVKERYLPFAHSAMCWERQS